MQSFATKRFSAPACWQMKVHSGNPSVAAMSEGHPNGQKARLQAFPVAILGKYPTSEDFDSSTSSFGGIVGV